MSKNDGIEEAKMNAISSARIVDLDSEGLVKNHAPSTDALHAGRHSEALALSRLSAVLQTSIELSEIIGLFFREIQRVVAADGISFEHTPYKFTYQLGTPKGRTSHYRIQTDSDYLGDLTLYRKSRDFTPCDLEKLDRMVTSLVFPLRNGLRYHEAVRASLTDGLTGAGNRIGLDSILSREVEQASRYNHPLSVMILDLDFFKNINDSHGHAVGDHVLKTIAGTIQNSSRNADMIFRYGGEEFVILLNKTDVAGAKIGAERIRQIIERTNISLGALKIKVTASIGVASLCHGEDRESLLRRADKALYCAKHSGRNQVTLAEPSLANA
ncbi:MAG: GGDEF domain-containing protein [Ketobacter sp. GenoA1]|nr:MAG: GGDEF domain-containing protein [Ketobacter sp. GenoA1]RLT97726.1 MAG: GGDEF domain-containing protein [Ketobacter sp.]